MYKKVFNNYNNLIKNNREIIMFSQNKIKLNIVNQYKIILINFPNIFLNLKKFYIFNFDYIYFFIILY